MLGTPSLLAFSLLALVLRMSETEFFDEKEEANRIAQKGLDDLEEIRSDFQSTFSTPAGERTLLSLYDFCKQMRTTFRASATESAFLEGRRSVLLKILEHLHMGYSLIR